jgi:hypothetical protein
MSRHCRPRGGRRSNSRFASLRPDDIVRDGASVDWRTELQISRRGRKVTRPDLRKNGCTNYTDSSPARWHDCITSRVSCRLASNSAAAGSFKRRRKEEIYRDLCMLPKDTDEPIVFFGAKIICRSFVSSRDPRRRRGSCSTILLSRRRRPVVQSSGFPGRPHELAL